MSLLPPQSNEELLAQCEVEMFRSSGPGGQNVNRRETAIHLRHLPSGGDVTFLTRERVRSTFMEDFRAFMTETVPEARRTFDWHHLEHDPRGIYSVDCHVNGMKRPLNVFALPGDDKTRDATISLLQFERWGLSFRSLGIFEDQEQIARKPLARFTDVCERQFASLTSSQDRLQKFLVEAMET